MTKAADLVLRFRRPISAVLHTLLIAAANQGAFLLRFDGDVPEPYIGAALALFPWLLVIRLATFVPFRLFEGLWRYTSLWDLRGIALAVTLSTALFSVVASFIPVEPAWPRSIYILDSVLLIGFMTGARLTRRVYREIHAGGHNRRVLIYGAGDAGEMIVRDMRQGSRYAAQPIGFIDDDHRKKGRRIHGVPVLGGRDRLAEIIETQTPEEVLIAIPSATRDTLRTIVRVLEPFKVRITTLPRLSDLAGHGDVHVDQIRQLKVEDLLARDPVGLDYAPVREFLAGKCVLVTGAGGSIGSELSRQIAAAQPLHLVLLDRYENSLFQIANELARSATPVSSVIADITDERRIDQVLSEISPDVVFHAAAHKHVPLMEENPCEAIKNNVRGTRLLAEAALRWSVERFVLISTDKAVNPTSMMGASKRLAELVVHSLNGQSSTRFVAVRFGNVLASNGSVVPTFLGQIAKGGPVTVTHPDMRRYFMLIPEAVQLVLHAACLPDDASLFVLDMGEQVKVVDMARDLIRLSGYVPDKDIAIQFTGIRPGEKMFEELVGSGELAEPSSMPKVLRVHANWSVTPDRAAIRTQIQSLEAMALEGRRELVLAKLTEMLPNYAAPVRPQTLLA